MATMIRIAVVLASVVIGGIGTSGGVALAQTERVPDAAVVNGVPQGLFVGRSLLTGRAVCLLFLSGGRITRAIPAGGLEQFDWARHSAAHAGDSGVWQMSGTRLIVQWSDGGVHEGIVAVHPDGIEFHGKRYARPGTANVAAIAGRWEATRGTAIAGGPGINRTTELIIQADGRYQRRGTIGGVVAGRAAAGSEAASGRVTIAGATIIFRSAAGQTTQHTFLPVAGRPVSAFGIDSDLFTRTDSAPASAALAPAPPASAASSHRGLYYALPAGWTSASQGGHFLLMPASASADSVVIVVLSGAEPLGGRSFDDWLSAKMAADLTGELEALQSTPPTPGRQGALVTLSAGRTVQDGPRGTLLQVYHAVSDGQQAGLAMAATASEAAMNAHLAGVQAVLRSLSFAAGGP